jgi:DNA-binding response OmpR family regulator
MAQLVDPEAIDLAALHYLIIDNNHHMLSILREQLRAIGCSHVLKAKDAADGFELFRDNPVDLLITDYALSPIDGLELTKMVRTAKDSPNQKVPIILLTGHTERRRVLAARDHGVTEILTKPVSPERLFQRIRSIMTYPRDFIEAKGFTGPDRRRRAVAHSGPEKRR